MKRFLIAAAAITIASAAYGQQSSTGQSSGGPIVARGPSDYGYRYGPAYRYAPAYGYVSPMRRYYRPGYDPAGAAIAGAALGLIGGVAAAAAAPAYYGYPYGYYAAPAYGYYAAPAYGYYGAPYGCDPYFGC